MKIQNIRKTQTRTIRMADGTRYRFEPMEIKEVPDELGELVLKKSRAFREVT